MSAPAVYLILGPSGAGRRALIADLAENGLDATEKALLLTFMDEPPPPPDLAEHLGRLTNLACRTWELDDDKRLIATIEEGVSHVFFVSNGRADPVDEIEAVLGWLPVAGASIGRVITVVDCALGHAHPELKRWYDACVHFSDVVLLGRRSSVPNAWIGEFTGRLRKEHFPCLVELIKNDEVENPALILEPQARRISTVFDAGEEWADLEDEDEDEESEGGDSGAGAGVDPYLEKLPSGRRVRELPDIRRFLDQAGQDQ